MSSIFSKVSVCIYHYASIHLFLLKLHSFPIFGIDSDFMALQIISSIDNIVYTLCTLGFFGIELHKQAEAVKKVPLVKSEHTSSYKLFQYVSLHTLIVLVSLMSMTVGWGIILRGQWSGAFYRMKYPQCQVGLQGLDITMIGDGKCDGGLYNRYECGFDGGGKRMS